MRLVIAIVSVLSLGLTTPVLVGAEKLQLAKVYRDYPGYFNPAVCENPNLGKPAAVKEAPAVKAPAAASEPKAVAPAAEMPQQSVSALYRVPSDNSPGFAYLGAWAGMVATRDTDADAGPDIDVSFDNGYGGGVAVGYDFGPVRLEVEASYRESDIDKVKVNGSEVDNDEELEVQALLVNGFADFGTGGNLTPYLGAGIGGAKIDLGDDDDTVLAGQLAAGVAIAVTPAVAIDLGYRFMMTDDPEIDDVEFEVQQHTAMLGLQFRF